MELKKQKIKMKKQTDKRPKTEKLRRKEITLTENQKKTKTEKKP